MPCSTSSASSRKSTHQDECDVSALRLPHGTVTILMRRIALICLLFLGFVSGTARASSIAPELEMAIHLKILSFDNGIKERVSGNTIVIAVLYPSDQKGSASDYVNAVTAIASKSGGTVHGKNVRAVAVPITLDLADRLSGVHVLYVVDGLASDNISAIGRIAASRKLPLLSGNRSYLSSGAAIAVVEKSNKPSIVVHAANSKACGMVLDSKLLRLAEVVK
jgi:hypothetical protein